jgi:hypothetical protein
MSLRIRSCQCENTSSYSFVIFITFLGNKKSSYMNSKSWQYEGEKLDVAGKNRFDSKVNTQRYILI